MPDTSSRFIKKVGNQYVVFSRKGSFDVPIHKNIKGICDGAKAAQDYAKWQRSVNRVPTRIVKTKTQHIVYIGQKFKTKDEAETYLKQLYLKYLKQVDKR